MPSRSIAVNVFGHEIKEPVSDRPEEQSVLARELDSGWLDALVDLRLARVHEPRTSRLSFNLTDEEQGLVNSTSSLLTECVIVGYALQQEEDEPLPTDTLCRRRRNPVGVSASEAVLTEHGAARLLLVVAPKHEAGAETPWLYAMHDSYHGLCLTFPVHPDQVFYRHEFRGGDEMSPALRREAWLGNVLTALGRVSRAPSTLTAVSNIIDDAGSFIGGGHENYRRDRLNHGPRVFLTHPISTGVMILVSLWNYSTILHNQQSRLSPMKILDFLIQFSETQRSTSNTGECLEDTSLRGLRDNHQDDE